MDITFEEVAFVIQDARFQQAIFDSDVPKPDKKFPAPPRTFSPSQFVKEHSIDQNTLVFEPIGRFFLEQCASNTTEEEEMGMLRFTDTIENLRKFDPAGLVQVADIEAVCERFNVKLEHLEDVTQEDASNNAAAEDREPVSQATVEEISVSAEVVAPPPPLPPHKHSSSAASPDRTALPPTALRGALSQLPLSLAKNIARISTQGQDNNSAQHEDHTTASQQRHSHLMSFQSDAPQRFDEKVDYTNNTQPMSTFYNALRGGSHQPAQNHHHRGGSHQSSGMQAQVYSAAVNAATLRKLAQEGKHHSPYCIRMNQRVNATIQVKLKPCYDRLVADKKMFHLYCAIKWYSLQPVTERDVRYHRVLGMGAFGTVNGCIVTSVGTMLAIKTMDKKRIKLKKAKSQVTAERDALEALAAHSSPYCLRLRYSYETKEAYHFILPIAIAGDLKFHLKEGPFTPARARYYACEVAMGLGHIHSLGLVIRDLKPRNILLTRSGHCQISDFGLAVAITEQKPVIQGRAGTEGYWSPEVINNTHYSMDADWWSFGVCLFEFLAGISPFSTKHTGLKTRNDGTRRAEVKFPEKFDETAKPLILALLSRRVTDRVQGMGEVLNEQRWAYWKDFDLGAMRRNELPPPWLPERGQIYAASQGEIQENEDLKETRKVKILPEDAIPFVPFVDIEGHQRDICKVLEILKSESRLTLEDATAAQPKNCMVM